jgi:hypothetical protein
MARLYVGHGTPHPPTSVYNGRATCYAGGNLFITFDDGEERKFGMGEQVEMREKQQFLPDWPDSKRSRTGKLHHACL